MSKVTTSLVIRSLQLLFAIIIAALYGIDLHNATQTSSHANSNWIYAEFVACLSILTCIMHSFNNTMQVIWSIWDWVLFILWVAQFGLFGKLYLGNDKANQGYGFTKSVSRMNAAAWVSLVNMLLWLAIGIHDVVRCCVRRKMNKATSTSADLEGAANGSQAMAQSNLSEVGLVTSEVKEDASEIKRNNKKSEAALAGSRIFVAPPPYSV